MMDRNGLDTAADGSRVRKNDMILIVGVLLLLTLLGLAFLFMRKAGDTVTVSVDGRTVSTYSLSDDRTVDIQTGEDSTQLNRLVIQDGKAYVESATCPDGICAAHRPISRDGEAIVCLPHRVVITVRTAQDERFPDIIT